MWWMTPIGFFSVVSKPADAASGSLTIRARVRGDLEALRREYLPGMGEIREGEGTDYPFRASAPRSELATAIAAMVGDLDYANFKHEVERRQGKGRALAYHQVWSVLQGLEHLPSAATWHPRLDERGNRVCLQDPSRPTPLAAWDDPRAVARVVPDGAMPALLNELALAPWHDPPQDEAGWKALAADDAIEEPPFEAPVGYRKAAGVVLREPDGRVWLVAPSNGFGGYRATFPKGTLDGLSAQAAALREAFEESGLKVRLLRCLVDVRRSQSYTRYYLAQRVGGHPADMGWESQAVMLAPLEALPSLLNSPYDRPIIDALRSLC